MFEAHGQDAFVDLVKLRQLQEVYEQRGAIVYGEVLPASLLALQRRGQLQSAGFHFKGEPQVFLNLDLISGMKYVHLLTENSLVKVGVLRKIFRKLGVYPYNGVNGAGTMQPLNKALSVFISPIL